MAFKTEAFVLRSRPWLRADRLYDLYLPQEGVVSVILRSAAKSSSKLAGHMLPFAKVRVMIGRGRRDHLAGVTILKDFSHLRTDLRLLTLASAVAEMLLHDKSLGHKFKEFLLIDNILHLLNEVALSDVQKSLLVRTFLWKYLSLLGYAPQLDKCLICNKSLINNINYYLPGRGIICQEHGVDQVWPVSYELINWLKNILQQDWHTLLDIKLPDSLNKEWGQISKVYYQTVFETTPQSFKLLAFA
jgi:DNA repair protein RecO (recombination protein O)